ncbi:UTP--glucose-1-phosphate uridylyltransferase [Candidatus Gottesmanbacteria bacterium RBG_16_37_8]|uniref:UTP--glucose-1-phosphate uridylyltransferase n=1 Tax=Candidatus Gottesmanbacteria bacterium RBG_16_37_8 TaxID=1798371 RepID=A0A1F5YT08_9BACT|nr:MAG: UTP--glucose-1-phosphate uridylyltransferase [Candidatus Gottesmanbacteria bacterium RBG_16_37_8]
MKKSFPKVRKSVIPAAGFGTRFLPQTKAMPKEMLPIVDKPVIQYVVEEIVASGITDIIMITGWHKRPIEDHFDYPFELEKRLEDAGKEKELIEVRRIANMANFIYVRQKGPYGNATPVYCARNVIGNEPFAVLWGDEFIFAKPPRLRQMIDVYEEYGLPVISAVRIKDKSHLSRYGIGDVKLIKDNVYEIKKIVEKPDPDKAPSNLATHGAYILPPEIFPIIENLHPGKSGELWLPDAIGQLLKIEKVLACEIKNAIYYDTGDKFEYLKTVIEIALKHPELNGKLRNYLKKLKI